MTASFKITPLGNLSSVPINMLVLSNSAIAVIFNLIQYFLQQTLIYYQILFLSYSSIFSSCSKYYRLIISIDFLKKISIEK